MISIVTGTLNRREYLPGLLQNTIFSDKNIEVVIVDGGSTDGTVEYLKSLDSNRLKLIEVGKRSNYGHYMNLGVKAASNEWICQWNDDCVLVTPSWSKIMERLKNNSMQVILFSWTNGCPTKLAFDGWRTYVSDTEFVMNYGLYHKDVFRTVGLYDEEFNYYCADGEMSKRASLKFDHGVWNSVKVVSDAMCPKRAVFYQSDIDRYHKELSRLNKGILKTRELLA